MDACKIAVPESARTEIIFDGSSWGSNRPFPQFPGRFFRHFDEKKRVILFDTNRTLAFLVTKSLKIGREICTRFE